MASKGYLRFKNRLVKFREDCELAEVVVNNKEQLKGEGVIFEKINAEAFPLLSARQDSIGSRTLVAKHLRSTIYVAFVKELYEELTEYLHYILRQGAQNGVDPNRVVGDNNITMQANDILSKGKKELDKMIIDQIFRKLENRRSTIDLINQIRNRLGLDIDQQLVEAAIPYLETRHIFVHADGKPEQLFLERFPNIQLDNNKKIALNAGFATNAYFAVKELVKAFDREMLARNYFPASEMQP